MFFPKKPNKQCSRSSAVFAFLCLIPACKHDAPPATHNAAPGASSEPAASAYGFAKSLNCERPAGLVGRGLDDPAFPGGPQSDAHAERSRRTLLLGIVDSVQVQPGDEAVRKAARAALFADHDYPDLDRFPKTLGPVRLAFTVGTDGKIAGQPRVESRDAFKADNRERLALMTLGWVPCFASFPGVPAGTTITFFFDPSGPRDAGGAS